VRAFSHYETALQRVGCTVRPRGLELPEELNFEDWAAVGRTLDEFAQSSQWLIGDWWLYPGHRHGDRQALVSAAGWEGPAYQTCCNAAVVCRAFEISRRSVELPFAYYAEAASLPPDKADKLLARFAKSGRRRSLRELREVKRRLIGASITVLQAGMSGGGEQKVVRVAARVIPEIAPQQPVSVSVLVSPADPVASIARALIDALRKKDLTPTAALAAIADAIDQILATSAVDKPLRAKLKRLRQAMAGSLGMRPDGWERHGFAGLCCD
jgi:hypothetical protein